MNEFFDLDNLKVEDLENLKKVLSAVYSPQEKTKYYYDENNGKCYQELNGKLICLPYMPTAISTELSKKRIR